MRPNADASSNFIWPPTIYGGAFVLAALATWFVPLPAIGPGVWRWIGAAAGVALIAAGAAVALAAEHGFKRAGTAVLPTRPTTAIVSHGVYRYTRNPMYLGMSLVLAGIGLAANSWWFVIALPVAMVAVFKLAIAREERYLEQKFGAEYRAYKVRVRRWL